MAITGLQAAQAISPGQELAAPAKEQAATWVFHHENVLGTSLEIKVKAVHFAVAQRAEEAALRSIDRQERLLSAWRPDSEFSRWANTRFQPVPVSADLLTVLARFDYWRQETGGALDASAEAAVHLWRQARAEGRLPSEREILETQAAIAQPHWALDESRGTATRLTDVPLALASFAKSYVSAHAADAAMQAGATGVMLNLGGDVVVRGALPQVVEIADPEADAENDRPLDRVRLTSGAIATSGSYRRGIEVLRDGALRRPELSHIVDPRTARPTGLVLSSTVIAPDAETAGAMATAFSVLSPKESAALAATVPGVAYLLVLQDGERVENGAWKKFCLPGLQTAAFPVPRAPIASSADAGSWDARYELGVGLELPRLDDARYRRPYVAVWVEDADHYPVRTLALWTQNPRWLPELRQWYRDDQVRNLSENTDVSKTISSATRPPGHYALRWDGKDNEGRPVRAGKYTVVVEASREHGGYQIERHEMNFDAQAKQATLQPGKELGTITLDYRKR